ncbi:MAG: glycosyltransferase family 2 protein [Candidatus Neomarinimicrobiota bacterium]
MNKILFITVNYRNTEITENFIQSFENLDLKENASIVIVDNDSTKESKESLKNISNKSKLDIRLVFCSNNLYYWGGANYVLKKLNLDIDNFPDWIIICNNDIIFNKIDLIVKLQNIKSNNYAVLAPSIISTKSKKNQNPHILNPISTLGRLYYNIFFINSVTGLFIYKIRTMLNNIFNMYSNKKISKPMEIYAPHGSFMIFSKIFFNNGGWIDSNFEMFAEELTTAEIVKRLKMKIFFNPDLEVMHDEHSISGSRSWKENFYSFKRAYYYFQKEYL